MPRALEHIKSCRYAEILFEDVKRHALWSIQVPDGNVTPFKEPLPSQSRIELVNGLVNRECNFVKDGICVLAELAVNELLVETEED